VAADKPKPPKSQSAPSGGFDGYEMSFVRERQRPEWQQPQPQHPQTDEWGVQQQEAWASRSSRGPRPLVVLAVALLLIAVLVVALLV
jgi:hypothetical protein